MKFIGKLIHTCFVSCVVLFGMFILMPENAQKAVEILKNFL